MSQVPPRRFSPSHKQITALLDSLEAGFVVAVVVAGGRWKSRPVGDAEIGEPLLPMPCDTSEESLNQIAVVEVEMRRGEI